MTNSRFLVEGEEGIRCPMTKNQDKKKKINWVNTIFISTAPFLTTLGIIGMYYFTDGPHLLTWIFTLFYIAVTGLSITGGYHRLFAHKSYEAAPLVKFFYLIFGSAGLQNSALKWSSDHRIHHKHVDSERDPYNAKRGFFHSHVKWIFFLDSSDGDLSNVKDLSQDPLVRWQHKYFTPLMIFFGFFFPALVAACWGDFWGGFIFGGFLRIVLNHHFTFCINSICHMFGSRPYSVENTARDNWFFSLFTYGEGYHNFHHKFQHDYRNGFKFYHWDPTKWLIKFFSAVKLAKNLKSVSYERILQAQLELDEARMQSELTIFPQLKDILQSEIMDKAREKFLASGLKLQALQNEYKKLKSAKLKSMEGRLKLLRKEMHHAKKELNLSFYRWKVLMKGSQKLLQAAATTTYS